MNKNEELYKKAISAIENLYADTSVPISKAKENLKSLMEEIEIMLEGLEYS